MDATREQAIEWCREHNMDFKSAPRPAPEGWMWAREGDGLILTAIFTNTDDADITISDMKD